MSTPAQRLRALLDQPGLVVCPVVGGPLSARLAQEVGFQTVFLGGLAVAAERFALPDLGLITFSDMLDQLRNTCAAVPGFPVIADADTGYGSALNVRRAIIEYARAGAAGALLEDQIWPKQCGHYRGSRSVVPAEEALTRVRAAIDARREAGADILIVARTDARSSVNLDEAVRRAKSFAQEGADIVFAEALETSEELRTFASAIARPTWAWANMMPKTPLVSRADLLCMGFKVVTYNIALPAMVHSARAALTALLKDDTTLMPPLAPFEELTELVGLRALQALESRYATATRQPKCGT